MRKEKGITLIELLIAMSIIGMIGLSLISLYIMGVKVFQKEFRNSSLQSENSVILNRIVNDAKEAAGTESSYDTYTGNTTDTLILKLPAKDANNNFIYDVNGNFVIDRIIYQKTNNNLKRIIIADPQSSRKSINNNISAKVTSFNITYTPSIDNAKNIEVTLVNQDSSNNEPLSVTNSTKVILRNN